MERFCQVRNKKRYKYINQVDHLLQWMLILIPVELFLFLVPLKPWIVLVIIGIAFMIGFLLRVFKVYPGENEPLVVDFSTSILAFLASYCISLVKDLEVLLVSKFFSPFFILIPHFVYIISNKKIKPPAMVSKIKRLKISSYRKKQSKLGRTGKALVTIPRRKDAK